MIRNSLFVLCLFVPAIEANANFSDELASAAIERTKHAVTYDGRYIAIAFPNGDVPPNIGVCTDVVIRAYRSLGIDLQLLVHQDMKANFAHYPSKRIWGLIRTDPNIDHRRVPNLKTFFARHGKKLPVTEDSGDYKPGNLVTWLLPGNLPHIGIVTDKLSPTTGNPLISHNIGRGPVLEDMLFDFKITGHYHYAPSH
ncbi:DUF1287 domain-containing protein [Psychrobium sp. 1_MG-2023]|uniref:DUF1287 domain-containing protein n=1 Tax=Psychrobium sp. 1_MG-2023 TaxID=3062624 RepID=UPI000C31C096|nr:DUF1287 domain-containing protein [Psychrobium sp. 1_MG-2023]MDP2562868.1 DUF1287 domain-containing protein [Psychrobium sp. 1_MG-2023]PKF57155.1 DUF1287 domain-containing protein [Alteromonadales bacterium alter-6D02]